MIKTMSIARNYRLLQNLRIKSASGPFLVDVCNTLYYDLSSCYSAANFGHNNIFLKEKLINQLDKISVCSRYVDNVYLNNLGHMVHKYFGNLINLKAGEKTCTLPSSNGVDAVETAIKLARAWGYAQKNIKEDQCKILFANGNFAGRTILASSVSSNAYQKKFYPKVPGFDLINYNDIESLKKYLDTNDSKNISAICLEPIQGENGVIIPNDDYFPQVRELCDKHNLLLICDEIQTGLGRTSKLLCSEHYNIKPDIVLLGKSLGGGFLPVSLCISSNTIMDNILPGEHGSTFGGNPLASRMATEVLEYYHSNYIQQNIRTLSTTFAKYGEQLYEKYNGKLIKNVRGKGLFWGIEFIPKYDAFTVAQMLTEYNIITNSAGNNTLRICPPFILNNHEAKQIYDLLNECFDDILAL